VTDYRLQVAADVSVSSIISVCDISGGELLLNVLTELLNEPKPLEFVAINAIDSVKKYQNFKVKRVLVRVIC